MFSNAAHNKTALYCAAVSILFFSTLYFFTQLSPILLSLLRNCNRVLSFFLYIYIKHLSHPPSPIYLLLLPSSGIPGVLETKLNSLVERNQAASNDPLVSFPRVCSSLSLPSSLSVEERDGEYFHELCRVLTRHKFFNMAILRPLASLGRERKRKREGEGKKKARARGGKGFKHKFRRSSKKPAGFAGAPVGLPNCRVEKVLFKSSRSI